MKYYIYISDEDKDKYELNKQYKSDEYLVFDNLFLMRWYYNLKVGKVFEVEVGKEIRTNGYKVYYDSIKLIEEVDRDKWYEDNWQEYIASKDSTIRRTIASLGYGLKELEKDDAWCVSDEIKRQRGIKVTN